MQAANGIIPTRVDLSGEGKMIRRIAAPLVIVAAIVCGFTLGLSRGRGQTGNYTILAATPLGNAFTYQGRLLDGGVAPANSTYDLQFTLFDQSSGGIQIAGPITLDNVPVVNGLFT